MWGVHGHGYETPNPRLEAQMKNTPEQHQIPYSAPRHQDQEAREKVLAFLIHQSQAQMGPGVVTCSHPNWWIHSIVMIV